MRLVCIAMVKNEGDIVEAFVRHNLRFVDGLVVVDNGSVDGTRRILEELIREGLCLVVMDDPDVTYAQSRKMTDLLATTASAFRPDWVLPIDADEMVVSRDGASLRAAIEAVPGDRVPVLPWRTYVPSAGDDASERNPVARLCHRRRIEVPQWTKVIVPARLHAGHSVVIGAGNHALFVGRGNEAAPSAEVSGVALAHFPVRSPDQIVGKVITGWLAYLSDPSRVSGINVHWEALYREFLSGKWPTPDDLHELAMKYGLSDGSGGVVEDPLGYGDALRYVDSASTPLLVRITRTAEQIALRAGGALGVEPVTARTNSEDEKPGREGGWSARMHVARPYCDVPPFRYVWERFRPQSVLDIGCGLGAYLSRFKEWGVADIVGVEAAEMGPACLVPGSVGVHNLERPLALGRRFDLVLCTEVVEHIASRFEGTMIDSIERHAARIIVFSGAQPGQPGIGHVNLRPLSYWADRWAAKGWRVLPWETLSFRALSTLLWFQRNTLILAREDQRPETEGPFTTRELATPTVQDMEWPGQSPGTYEYTLLGRKLAESFADAGERQLERAGRSVRFARLVWRFLPDRIKDEIRARAILLR